MVFLVWPLIVLSSLGAVGGDLRLITPSAAKPATIAELKAALEPIATKGITRTIQSTTPAENTEAVWHYFREVGLVFSGMSTNGNYTSEFVTASINQIPTPLVTTGYLLEIKSILLSLYRMAYTDRMNAELPPSKWLPEVAEAFTASIDLGLKKSGRAGLR
jgi:hypothetical protein